MALVKQDGKRQNKSRFNIISYFVTAQKQYYNSIILYLYLGIFGEFMRLN